MHESGHISSHVHDNLDADLHKRLNEVQKQLEDLELTDLSIDEIHLKHARLELLQHRKDSLSQLLKRGMLTAESFHKFELDIDSELDLLARNVSAPQGTIPSAEEREQVPVPDQDL
jgi:hypothetical protein